MEPQEQTIQKPIEEKVEQPLEKIHPHYLSYLSYYFLGVVFAIIGIIAIFYILILGAILFLIGVFVFVIGETSRRAETFYIWENGVEREYKMFSSSHKFVEYRNIQNMEVDQSFLQNIFNVGNIDFNTAGGSAKEEELIFNGIKNPHEIERIVQGKMKN